MQEGNQRKRKIAEVEDGAHNLPRREMPAPHVVGLIKQIIDSKPPTSKTVSPSPLHICSQCRQTWGKSLLSCQDCEESFCHRCLSNCYRCRYRICRTCTVYCSESRASKVPSCNSCHVKCSSCSRPFRKNDCGTCCECEEEVCLHCRQQYNSSVKKAAGAEICPLCFNRSEFRSCNLEY
eukprot:TRINITY_DN11508_c0_g1_i1.p1 TRINITY_DN11508_c0_g1~~TRINITY_DN11508_c0_g1_i1.p1  ORF type:complete len:179 (-),score=1.34 TRINITY_DN11508_c0_g1_i1:35-571(-)